LIRDEKSLTGTNRELILPPSLANQRNRFLSFVVCFSSLLDKKIIMDSKFKRITSAIALFLALAIGQLYLPVSFADSVGNATASPQQATAILTTAGNRPVMVNGASAISGATVLTGAMIETPDKVGASMSIPGHFSLDIAPRAKLTVEFDRNNIRVTLIQGCVVLHTLKGTTGEIDTSRGVAGKSDGSRDNRIDVCDPSIATAPAAAGGGGGLGTGGTVAIIAAVAGALALIPLLGGGSNPSPGAP
jgi:hypothetical protein